MGDMYLREEVNAANQRTREELERLSREVASLYRQVESLKKENARLERRLESLASKKGGE